jgi:hypothetical protein
VRPRLSDMLPRHLIGAAIFLVATTLACNAPAATTLPSPTLRPEATLATGTSEPSGSLRVLAEEACLGTEYTNCVEGLLSIAQTAPGSLVAICDYGNATGDIVIIGSEAEAESKCSAAGTISPSRVVGVLQLP